MSTADTTVRVAWRRRHDDTLELLLANTALQVPARLGTLLLHPDRRSITNDPAADLLRAEQDLRWQAVQLGHEFDHANHDLGEHTREEQDMAARADVGGDVRRLRGEVRRRVADATATAFLRLALVDATRDDLTVLRQFVCEADVPDGPLADAAAGWRRSARRPQGVLEYASEADFVAADPRRALPGSGNRRADGEIFGVSWRRDGDDDDPLADQLPVQGCWQVCHLAATAEIYACRQGTGSPNVSGCWAPEWTSEVPVRCWRGAKQ